MCSISSTSQNLPEDSIACAFDVKTYLEENRVGRGVKELLVGQVINSSAREVGRVGGSLRLIGMLSSLLGNVV